MKKTALYAIVTIILLSFAVSAYAKTSGSIEADELNYNMQTKHASASGNVVFTHGMDVLKGNRAEGVVDRQITVLGSPVRGNFVSQKATMTASKVIWTADKEGKKSDIIEASGNVKIKQGQANFLNAPYVKINAESKQYTANGGVEALYNGMYILANEVLRDGENFCGNGVKKLEDKVKKYSMSAESVSGKISGKDEIISAVADKKVIFNYVDKNGLKSTLYGNKAVYVKETGTITISGNAYGIREDGKTVKADKIIYNEKTKQYEASGNTKITFITGR